jgi:hypothetical protein
MRRVLPSRGLLGVGVVRVGARESSSDSDSSEDSSDEELPKISYWYETGKYQKLYEKLKILIPREGKASTEAGEALRCAVNLYYQRNNNGRGANSKVYKDQQNTLWSWQDDLGLDTVNPLYDPVNDVERALDHLFVIVNAITQIDPDAFAEWRVSIWRAVGITDDHPAEITPIQRRHLNHALMEYGDVFRVDVHGNITVRADLVQPYYPPGSRTKAAR